MQSHRIRTLLCAAALCGVGLMAAGSASAAERIEVGTVGGPNAIPWPYYIADAKGFFADEGLAPDLNYSQSSAATMQALTAGSIVIAFSAGLADPIHAIARGAPIAIIRIEGQVGPYALLAKPAITSIKDLKGKKISVDEATGTTLMYFDKMLIANGLKQSDCDYIYAGATSQRFAALTAGAVDAAMLTMPFNFRAEAAGFRVLGLVPDYAKNLPFDGMVVNRAYAEKNRAVVKKVLAAFNRAVTWFNNDKNKDEAVDILTKLSKQSRGDVAKSYDLFQQVHFFEPTGKVSLADLENVIVALRGLGDQNVAVDVHKLVMPGVTEITP